MECDYPCVEVYHKRYTAFRICLSKSDIYMHIIQTQLKSIYILEKKVQKQIKLKIVL